MGTSTSTETRTTIPCPTLPCPVPSYPILPCPFLSCSPPTHQPSTCSLTQQIILHATLPHATLPHATLPLHIPSLFQFHTLLTPSSHPPHLPSPSLLILSSVLLSSTSALLNGVRLVRSQNSSPPVALRTAMRRALERWMERVRGRVRVSVRVRGRVGLGWCNGGGEIE